MGEKQSDIYDEEVQVLMECYKMADQQLQMRIRQRDSFAIQLMISVGALLGVAISTQEIIIRQVCITLLPFLCTYFCQQIFSSYEVHHRLVYYMKNVLEERIQKLINSNVMMWESFCAYDRSIIQKSKIGGRETFFRKLKKIRRKIFSCNYYKSKWYR